MLDDDEFYHAINLDFIVINPFKISALAAYNIDTKNYFLKLGIGLILQDRITVPK